MTERLALNAVTSKIVVCPKCGERIVEDRLQKHLKKVHSPEKELIRRAKLLEQEKLAKEKKRIEAEQKRIVQCPVCKTDIKIKNLATHLHKVHDLDIVEAQKLQAAKKKVLVPLPSVINAGTQSNFTHSDPEPIRSGGLFVSGGAVGLGKRR